MGPRSREGTDQTAAAESTLCPRTWGLGWNRGHPQRDWKPEPWAPGGGLQRFDQGRSEQSGMNWAPEPVPTFRPESPACGALRSGTLGEGRQVRGRQPCLL